MARPPKDKADLMNVPFRVMLTAEQRELIGHAASAMGQEASTWARSVLLLAALEIARKEPVTKPKRRK
jgi:uncharacterized protein (DUF1778 family)